MIIACPNCSTQYKIDPARFSKRTITFRCRKCERKIKFDMEVLKNDKTLADSEHTLEVTEITEDHTIQEPEPAPPHKAEKTASEPAAAATAHEKQVRNISPGRRKNIIVADDEISICILVEEILTSAGYNVTTALDGLDAYEKITTEKPDLVILDLLMPKMTGFEVLKEIRKENIDVPVLVMTAIYKKASQVLVVKELGANGYLEKPFSPDHLLFRVENLLMAATQKE